VRTRRLGRTGLQVSEVGFGAWAIGGSWGSVDDDTSMQALHAAVDAGVTFIDTADVYGDGHSEQLIGRLLRERDEDLVVATKMGRRVPLDPEAYTYEAFRGWLDRSRQNLGVDTIDLVQLHALGREIYDRPQVWEALDQLVDEEVVAHYGVSVETVDEAQVACRTADIAAVQIILNLFRVRPVDEVLPAAAAADVGIIARVPLASGLLTGKFDRSSTFEATDHRAFNRHGEEFDVGETFAGVDFETGLEAVERLQALVPASATTAQFALRWVLMHEAVSTVIPGAKRPDQVRDNVAASDVPALTDEVMSAAREVYDDLIAPQVHHRW
jgi:aryl-alcohol dehydrogenase-like predicted oxidoreductase